jgi:hypothetical protein
MRLMNKSINQSILHGEWRGSRLRSVRDAIREAEVLQLVLVVVMLLLVFPQ